MKDLKLQHLLLNYDEIYNEFHPESHIDSQLLIELLPPSIISVHLTFDGLATMKLSINKRNHNLTRFALGLLSLAKAITGREFPLLKEVRSAVEYEAQLNDHGVADAFAGTAVNFGYSSWPHSKATLEESDLPPPPPPSPPVIPRR